MGAILMNGHSPAPDRYNGINPAERLRDQAAACRRLSSVARTETAGAALIGVAVQLETDATQLDAAGGR
jgi:hypothetical protein